MHAGTCRTSLWLRHKSRIKAEPLCNGTHCRLERHNPIRGFHRTRISEVNFMLPGRFFMMRGFDFKPHILQRHHHITTGVFSQIQRADIHISGLFMSYGCRHAVFILVEQEKFTFRINLKRISFLFNLFHRLFQDFSRADRKRCSICPADITQKSCNFSLLRSPWQDYKGIQIRAQIHILFPVSQFSVHAGTINQIAVVFHILQLGSGHGNVFERAEHVCKLQTNEFNVFLLYHLQNFFSGFHASLSSLADSLSACSLNCCCEFSNASASLQPS